MMWIDSDVCSREDETIYRALTIKTILCNCFILIYESMKQNESKTV